jgi:hypothetical protein
LILIAAIESRIGSVGATVEQIAVILYVIVVVVVIECAIKLQHDARADERRRRAPHGRSGNSSFVKSSSSSSSSSIHSKQTKTKQKTKLQARVDDSNIVAQPDIVPRRKRVSANVNDDRVE